MTWAGISGAFIFFRCSHFLIASGKKKVYTQKYLYKLPSFQSNDVKSFPDKDMESVEKGHRVIDLEK